MCSWHVDDDPTTPGSVLIKDEMGTVVSREGVIFGLTTGMLGIPVGWYEPSKPANSEAQGG